MIIVYTGNGKGKTSACIGQAMRALGRDFAVGFGQFMKQPGCAGEQTVLARLLGDDFLAGGKGFLRREEDRPAHREAALATLDWARQRLERLDLLVLDETLYALKAGILERSEVEGLMDAARRARCHLVLSGRTRRTGWWKPPILSRRWARSNIPGGRASRPRRASNSRAGRFVGSGRPVPCTLKKESIA